MKLNVIRCYALAWKSFSKWWIPLCLISGIIFVFEIVPRILVRADLSELKITARSSITAVLENDPAKLAEILPKVRVQTARLMRRLTRFGLYIFPFIALFTIILLMYANWAVKNRQERRRPLATLVYIAFVHVMLAIGKLLAFFFFFFLGAYLYVKLFFVSLIMLEGRKRAGAAIKISWQMTRGNFWELFLIVVMNTGIQFLSLPTVIGTIPATGFVNTARAAAFRMIWEEGSYAGR
ncbi:hypothetical protein ES703_38157 [subsurface metagenome]